MKITGLLLTTALLVPCGVHADCSRDSPPSVPDVETASEIEMLDAQLALTTYITNNNAYLDCLDAEGAQAGADEATEPRAARTTAYNDAIDEMTATTSAFNEAMRAFRLVHP